MLKTSKKNTGVLIVQLGTPDSPKTNDVRRYLSEFLNDPRVIDLPWLGRKLLVNGIIVPFRASKSAKIYKQLFDLSDGVSPLITHTEAVVKKLQARFTDSDLTVHMAMRYQNPSLYDVLEKMRKKNYDHIIVLPMFPHYASASSGSAIDLAMNIMRKWWVIPEVSIINQFWDNEGYIDSIIERSKAFNLSDYDHILFSYHGLPDRHVDKVYEGSDLCTDQPCETEMNEFNKFCYKATCYATTRLIADKLGLKESDYTVCFQSRLDKKWLTPFSDKVVEEQGKKGAKKLLAFSPAFVADCLETVIEIGDEYQEIFEEHGGEKIQLVPSSNSHDRFIDGLEELLKERM
ncbi:MAG: ferrochelatase [Crocinitomicaceae bacterium]|nr:ferrochelatase [Crocinitomicaceae bacterium]